MNGAHPGKAGILFAYAGGVLFALSLLYGSYAYLVLFGRVVEAEPGAGIAGAVAWNVALFSAFALHHSVLARTGLKRRVAAVVGPALERSTYVWIASLLFIGVYAAWRPVPGVLWTVAPPASVLMIGIQIFSGVMTLRAAARIDPLHLAGVRQVMPARPTEGADLSASGGYAFVRHPIYLAWLLLVWPSPVMTGTRLTFAAISTLYLVIAIPLEERDLARTFGPAYEDYRQRVRWRLLPGIY